MEIYTSYYAKIKALEAANILPIAISIKPPQYFSGPVILDLAPEYRTLRMHPEKYCQIFDARLKSLKVPSIIRQIADTKEMAERATGAKYVGVALLCYESPKDFCHRYMVGEWLNRAGFKVKEFSVPNHVYSLNVPFGEFSRVNAPENPSQIGKQESLF